MPTKKQPVRVDKEPKMGDTESLLALSEPIDKTGHPDFTLFSVNEEFNLAAPPVMYSCCVKSYGVDFGFIFVTLAIVFIVCTKEHVSIYAFRTGRKIHKHKLTSGLHLYGEGAIFIHSRGQMPLQ